MDGLARFTIDFSKRKNKKLKNYLYRFINRLDFHGPIESWAKQLEIHNVQLYQNFQRHEIIHRKKINSNSDIKISFNDLIVKACAMAIAKNPETNISWVNGKIHQYKNSDT